MTEDTGAPSAQEILDRLNGRPIPANARFVADLAIQSPLFEGSFVAHVQALKGDSLFASLRLRGLGMEVGRVLVSTDSVFVYNRVENEYVAESIAVLPTSQLLNTAEALPSLLGFARVSESSSWTLTSVQAGYRLESGDRILTVDRDQWNSLALEIRLPSGETDERIQYQEYGSMAGGQNPRRVIYNSPTRNVRVVLYVRSLELNVDELRIPSDPRQDAN